MTAFLALYSFILPIITQAYKNKLPLIVLAVVIILLHQVFAIINTYIHPFAIASSDNLEFYQLAHHFSLSLRSYYQGVDTAFFIQLIGTLYRVFGSARLLSAEFTILAFSFSLVLFPKLYYQINESYKSLALAIILYAYLPSLLIYSAITIREPFEILFLMLSCYFAGKFITERFSSLNLLLSMTTIFIMGFFHHALTSYAYLFIIILLVVKLVTLLKSPAKLFWWLFFPGFLLIILSCTPPLSQLIDHWLMPILWHTFSPLNTFREKSVQLVNTGNSHYSAPLIFSDFRSFLLSLINAYLYYQFAPFPWQLTGFKFLYACSEAILRFILLVLACYTWLTTSGAKKNKLLFLLLIYFSLTVLWALGTLNYGTAIRHNLTSFWILVVIATPLLHRLLQRILFYFIPKKFRSLLIVPHE